MPGPVIAYCGPAAVPQDFWIRWNGDPVLLAALAALVLAVGRGRSSDARAGWGAIALMLVTFVSPLQGPIEDQADFPGLFAGASLKLGD